MLIYSVTLARAKNPYFQNKVSVLHRYFLPELPERWKARESEESVTKRSITLANLPFSKYTMRIWPGFAVILCWFTN